MKKPTFELQVVTVGHALFDGDAHEMSCRTKAGDITILAHHEPLITQLGKGGVRVVDNDGKEHTYFIERGVLEISNNRAVVICSSNE